MNNPINLRDPLGLSGAVLQNPVCGAGCVEVAPESGDDFAAIVTGTRGSNEGLNDYQMYKMTSWALATLMIGRPFNYLTPQLAGKFADLAARNQQKICKAGNVLQEAADATGGAAVAVGGTGVGVAATGVITANPLAVEGGKALIGVGAVLGEAAGVMQFTGGLLQGISGHGFGNSLKAVASGGLGVMVSRGLKASIPRGWHGQTRANAISNNKAVGNTIAVAQQLSKTLAPTQVNCGG